MWLWTEKAVGHNEIILSNWCEEQTRNTNN